MSAALDSSPEDSDIFKAHYKRMMAEAELVFVYESKDGSAGSAFLVELDGVTFVATNWHVFDELILRPGNVFFLKNKFGRKLLITSPYYYRLKEQRKPSHIPEHIDEVMPSMIFSDLVLIPYKMDYFVMDAFKPAEEPAVQKNQTAIAFGNTTPDGSKYAQGFINSKEGIINHVNRFCFGIISGARKGNSGGPVLNLQNQLVGMLSSGGGPQGEDGADQSVCIRMDYETLDFYKGSQFETIPFPSNVFVEYTDDLKADYKPEPHHSRDKGTPHLSIGLAGSNSANKENINLWDIRVRKQNHRPLYCYNWDIISRDRLMRLCATYGQTVAEFIPEHWIKIQLADTIRRSTKEYDSISKKYSDALRSRIKMESYTTRAARMTNAKRSKILDALRDIYNARHETGKKMRKNGDIVDISECIENLDAGL